MRIECPHCGAASNVPDDKLPEAPRFKMRCPKCGQESTVERDLLDSHDLAPDPNVEPEILPPGAQAAFLYLEDDAWTQTCAAFFEQRGWHVGKAGTPAEALAKLRLNSYQAIVMSESEALRPLVSEIRNWPGLTRRGLSLILVGEAAQSHDPHAAFRTSANMYLNRGDNGRASEFLELALAEYEERYLLLNQALLQAAGGDETQGRA